MTCLYAGHNIETYQESRAGHLRYFFNKKIESTHFFKTITLQPISAPFLFKKSTPSQINLIKNAKNIVF